MPAAKTACPTLIKALPAAKVTEAELLTAPFAVVSNTSLVRVKSVNLFLIKLLVI